jgi:hypothetical protein
MEACEAKEHVHDSKQRHQVEGPIMQAKEWMRDLGGATYGAREHKGHKVKMSVLQETGARESTRPPRPAGLPPI